MVKIEFLNEESARNIKLDYVVIIAKYQNKWIVVRHKDRLTWEIPGGHIEPMESSDEAASRELIEETGAQEFTLYPINIYSVSIGKKTTFGKLFYADITSLGNLPDYEIAEIGMIDFLPEDLTYPLIQPYLFAKGIEYINSILSC